jgi:hypothetical protein
VVDRYVHPGGTWKSPKQALELNAGSNFVRAFWTPATSKCPQQPWTTSERLVAWWKVSTARTDSQRYTPIRVTEVELSFEHIETWSGRYSAEVPWSATLIPRAAFGPQRPGS